MMKTVKMVSKRHAVEWKEAVFIVNVCLCGIVDRKPLEMIIYGLVSLLP